MMHLTVAGRIPWSMRTRSAARAAGGAFAQCPRCGHSRRWFHRGACAEELQVIYDPDGVRCGCTDGFHA
jgi:hypothetical protein